MSGQNRKDPFHVNRDKVRDNTTTTRKVRIKSARSIRSQVQWATTDLGSPPASQTVDMPYAGNLRLTVNSAASGFTITINNPFIVDATTPIVLSGAPETTSSVAFASPGQATLTLGSGATDGVYIISVGRRNDRRKNPPFGQ